MLQVFLHVANFACICICICIYEEPEVEGEGLYSICTVYVERELFICVKRDLKTLSNTRQSGVVEMFFEYHLL